MLRMKINKADMTKFFSSCGCNSFSCESKMASQGKLDKSHESDKMFIYAFIQTYGLK